MSLNGSADQAIRVAFWFIRQISVWTRPRRQPSLRQCKERDTPGPPTLLFQDLCSTSQLSSHTKESFWHVRRFLTITSLSITSPRAATFTSKVEPVIVTEAQTLKPRLGIHFSMHSVWPSTGQVTTEWEGVFRSSTHSTARSSTMSQHCLKTTETTF